MYQHFMRILNSICTYNIIHFIHRVTTTRVGYILYYLQQYRYTRKMVIREHELNMLNMTIQISPITIILSKLNITINKTMDRHYSGRCYLTKKNCLYR